MLYLRYALAILVLLGLTGCQYLATFTEDDSTNETGTTMEQTEVYRTDLEGLMFYLDFARIPHPDAVYWQQITQGNVARGEDDLPAPTDWYIVAALEYDEPTAVLADNLNLTELTNPVYLDGSFVAEWFPDEVASIFVKSGDYWQIDAPRFDGGSLFLLAGNRGYLVFVDNYIFVTFESN